MNDKGEIAEAFDLDGVESHDSEASEPSELSGSQ